MDWMSKDSSTETFLLPPFFRKTVCVQDLLFLAEGCQSKHFKRRSRKKKHKQKKKRPCFPALAHTHDACNPKVRKNIKMGFFLLAEEGGECTVHTHRRWKDEKGEGFFWLMGPHQVHGTGLGIAMLTRDMQQGIVRNAILLIHLHEKKGILTCKKRKNVCQICILLPPTLAHHPFHPSSSSSMFTFSLLRRRHFTIFLFSPHSRHPPSFPSTVGRSTSPEERTIIYVKERKRGGKRREECQRLEGPTQPNPTAPLAGRRSSIGCNFQQFCRGCFIITINKDIFFEGKIKF